MTPEAKTKQRVKSILENAGAYYFFPAANGYGHAGIPDIIACVNGCFLAIECKAGKGKTTALQERELEKIRAAGGASFVVYDTPTDMTHLKNAIWILNLRPL
jgi:Holliday junction resolvase